MAVEQNVQLHSARLQIENGEAAARVAARLQEENGVSYV
jgi:hypothetical protein